MATKQPNFPVFPPATPSSSEACEKESLLQLEAQLAEEGSQETTPCHSRTPLSLSHLNSSSANISTSSCTNVSTSTSSAVFLVSTPRRHFHVKALFNYQADSDSALPRKGLTFRHGDILYLVNASDPDWWQAQWVRPLTNEVDPATNGLVPSWSRMMRKRRLRRLKVNFSNRDSFINQPLASSSGNQGRSIPSLSHPHINTILSTSDSRANSFTLESTPQHAFGSPVRSVDISSCSSQQSRRTLGDSSADSVAAPSSNFVKSTTTGGHGKRSSGGVGGLLRRWKLRSNNTPPNANGQRSTLFANGRSEEEFENGTTMNKDNRARSLDSVIQLTEEVREVDLFYQRVQLTEIPYARPVILFGPLREHIAQRLFIEHPTRFAPCVVYTTRPPRAVDVEYVNYHNVATVSNIRERIQRGEWVEVESSADGHISAISVASLQSSAQAGVHLVLHLQADQASLGTSSEPTVCVSRVSESTQLHPISVLLQYRGALHLRQILMASMQWAAAVQHLSSSTSPWPRLPGLHEDVTNYRQLWERSHALQSDELAHCFSAVATGDTFETMYDEVLRALAVHSAPRVWLPSKESFT